MDFEQELSRELQAITVVVQGKGAEAAIERAAQRRRRQQMTTGLIMLVMVLVGGGWIYARLAGPVETVDVVAGGPAVSQAAISGEMDWTLIDTDIPVFLFGDRVQTDDGMYYQLSTAPERFSATYPDLVGRKAIYRSEDGISWEGDDADVQWASRLDRRGNTLYALGTAPGLDGGIDVVQGTSDNGGRTWLTQVLPLQEAVGIPGVVPETAQVSPLLSVSATATVAAVSGSPTYDWTALVVAEIRGAGYDLFPTVDGLVYSPEPHGSECVEPFRQSPRRAVDTPNEANEESPSTTDPFSMSVCEISWSELGFESPPFLGRNTRVLVAGLDDEFVEVDVPFANQFLLSLDESRGRFLAVSYAQDGYSRHVWLSERGRDWQEVSLPIEVDHQARFGLFEGDLYVISSGSSRGLEVWHLGDSGEWQSTQLAESANAAIEVNSSMISEHGIAVFAQDVNEYISEDAVIDPLPITVLVTRDGVSWFESQIAPSSWVTGVFMGSDSVLLNLQVGMAEGQSSVESRTLVGTFPDASD